MPAQPLNDDQIADARRLKEALGRFQSEARDSGRPAPQSEIAARLGFGQSALSQYINGRIPLNVPVLVRFCALLQMPMDAISPRLAAEAELLTSAAFAVSDLASPPADDGASSRKNLYSHTVPKKRPEVAWEVLNVTDVADWPDIFETKMPDDSMAPAIPMGTVLVFRKSAAPTPGHGVLVRHCGSLLVRRMVVQPGGAWVGEAKNGGYAPISAKDGAEIVAALQGVMSGAVE